MKIIPKINMGDSINKNKILNILSSNNLVNKFKPKNLEV
jgi:hypothetical protein